jgi:hypothetical protein
LTKSSISDVPLQQPLNLTWAPSEVMNAAYQNLIGAFSPANPKRQSDRIIRYESEEQPDKNISSDSESSRPEFERAAVNELVYGDRTGGEEKQKFEQPPREPFYYGRGDDDTLDGDLTDLSHKMDVMSSAMKKEILAFFYERKRNLMDANEAARKRERQEASGVLSGKVADLAGTRQMLADMEDACLHNLRVYENMASHIKRKREREESLGLMRQAFGAWKDHHSEWQHQVHMERIAEKHHQQRVLCAHLSAWRRTSFNLQKNEMQKFWTAKTEEVSARLISEYEFNLAEMRRELAKAELEIQKQKEEQLRLREDLKKSFMRGVCALNMEALTILKVKDSTEGTEQEGNENLENIMRENGAQYAFD